MKQIVFRPTGAPKAAFLTALILLCGVLQAFATQADSQLIFSYNQEGYPPYLIYDEGHIGGITVEILREAVSGLGFELAVTLQPEKRGHELLVRGQVDTRGKAKEWVDYPDQFDWSAPFLEPSSVIVSRADAPITTADVNSGREMTIAAILGFHYPELKAGINQGNITRVDMRTPEKLLQLVHMGRVDGAIMDLFTARWLIRQSPDYGPKDFFMDETPLSTVGYRLMFNKNADWRGFIKRFDAKIETMKTEGRIQAIIDGYR